MKVHLKGFTVIELMVSVTILSILAAITIPNFSRFIAQNRLDNSISSIFSALHLARAHAVAHSSSITLCPFDSGSCLNDWQQPIVVFIDDNANLTLDNGEFILKNIGKVFHSDELSYPRNGVTYRPDGSINFMQSGSFVYCNKTFPDLKGNRLTVSQAGRVRVRDSDKCEIPEV